MNFNKEFVLLRHKIHKKFLNVDLGLTFPTPNEATDVGNFSIFELYEMIPNLQEFEPVVFDVEYTESNNEPENEEELFLIWSFEHNAYWAPNGNGYTFNHNEAGLYTKDRAISICDSASLGGIVFEAMIPATVLKHL